MASKNRAHQLSWRKKLLFGAVTATSLLLLAELGVRGWSYFVRGEFERYDVTNGTFYLVPGVYRDGRTRINAHGFAGADLESEAPGLWRIAAVGESTTFSRGNAVNSWPAILNQMLDARERPGRRYDVLNAGIEGMTSDQIARRLATKVLPLEPKVVLIWSGWNDLLKFDPVGQTSRTRWADVSRAIDRLYLVKGLRKLAFYYFRPRLQPPATGPESRTGRFQEINPTYFTDNLRNMIHSSRSNGAKPVLLTLGTVLREEMTVAELGAAGVFFPYYPSAYAVNDFIDLIESYNRAIREVAKELSVPVVPIDRILAAREDFRRLFFDTMHTTQEGDQIIAKAILAVLIREKIIDQASDQASTERSKL